jgi:hypothetical protein
MGRSVAVKAGSSPVPRGTEFGPPRGLTSLDGARSLVAARESFACRLLAGIDRRGITDKRAARDAGTHPSTFKRLRAGLTTRVDCALVAALARHDSTWLDDVFGPPLDDNGQPFATPAPVATLAAGDWPPGWPAGWPPGWSVLAPALAVSDPRGVLTQAGLLDRAAIYRVEPHAVTTLWLGATLRTEADALGRTLAARRDRRFAGPLEQQIRALTGPRVTRFVDVVTAGVRATWRRLAVPNGLGLVTHIVEFEEIEELG